MTGASGRQRAKEDALKVFTLSEPDPSKLVRFGALTMPMFEQVMTLARQNSNLRTTRDLLLPRLISGEIDVSDAAMPVAAE